MGYNKYLGQISTYHNLIQTKNTNQEKLQNMQQFYIYTLHLYSK